MSKERAVTWLVFVLTVLAMATPAFSQLSSGTILGTVADQTGAVIPGVSVRLSNPATNFSRETLTNESGNFRVDQLPIGTYNVEVELAGFKKELRNNIKVDIDQRVRLDFVLEPGQVSEVLEVTMAAPLVQSEDSSVGQVIEERKIVTLPLNGRDFSQLAYIVPGAFAPRPGSSLGNRGGFSVAGLNENTNQFLLDGVNNNGTGTMEIAARINVDAVGEFKVQTGTYSAQYGRYAGAQVDVVTKSGTNNIHGTGFGFLRNDNLDARNFFDPYPLAKLPEFKRLQFGASIGGPIIRNKVFFFAGYQQQRSSSFITTAPSVPQPKFFNGDLSAFSGTIKDPETGLPFQNNQIPANKISPITKAFAQFWPAPTSSSLTKNASALLPTPDNFEQPNGKIDWQITPNHRFAGSYNYYNNKLFEWPIAGRPEVPGFMTDSLIRSQGLSLAETATLGTNMVNEFRAGLGRVRRVRQQEHIGTNWNATLGIPGTAADVEPLAWGVPYVTITGFSRIGDNTNMPQPRVDQTFSIADNFSILKANHAFKFGVDYFQQQMNIVFITNGRGVFDFTGFATGNAMADFLLGIPFTTTRNPPLGPLSSHPRRTSINGFFQDDWKATRSLTFNIGLRYEFTGHIREKYGKLAAFDPTIDGGKGGMRLIGDSPRFDNAVDTFQKLYPTLSIVRSSEELVQNDKNNFAPRFGFAWSPRSGTVVRGAYGIFYQIDDLCYCDYYQNPPFNLSQRFTNTASNIQVTMADPWAATSAVGAISMSGVDKNLAEAYYQQFSLGIQHEVPGGLVLDVSYQGKKGTKLDRIRDINQPVDRSVASPVRPFPLFSRINYLENSASSIYHGLHTRVEKRTSRGESFLLSYVFGKMIDDATSSPQDSYNLKAERALSSDDVRHRFSLSYIYPLPFGKNERFGHNVKGVIGELVSDWELSGIARTNSGSPLNPQMSGNNSRTGNGWDRPNLIGDPKKSDPSPDSWWNAKAFCTNAACGLAPGSFGTAGRNILIGPGSTQIDFSVQKRFDVAEAQQLQFRFEAFNVLNHANFDSPTATPNSSRFGVASSAQASRQLQFGLKYIF
jgi:outer membrane receptor protein involved in Fe transport